MKIICFFLSSFFEPEFFHTELIITRLKDAIYFLVIRLAAKNFASASFSY